MKNLQTTVSLILELPNKHHCKLDESVRKFFWRYLMMFTCFWKSSKNVCCSNLFSHIRVWIICQATVFWDNVQKSAISACFTAVLKSNLPLNPIQRSISQSTLVIFNEFLTNLSWILCLVYNRCVWNFSKLCCRCKMSFLNSCRLNIGLP